MFQHELKLKFMFSIFSHAQTVRTVSSRLNRAKDVLEVHVHRVHGAPKIILKNRFYGIG